MAPHGTLWHMADDEKTQFRMAFDEPFRATLEDAKRLTGITTTTDVIRHAVTTLVRKLKSEGRIGA